LVSSKGGAVPVGGDRELEGDGGGEAVEGDDGSLAEGGSPFTGGNEPVEGGGDESVGTDDEDESAGVTGDGSVVDVGGSLLLPPGGDCVVSVAGDDDGDSSRCAGSAGVSSALGTGDSPFMGVNDGSVSIGEDSSSGGAPAPSPFGTTEEAGHDEPVPAGCMAATS
jgi:hypothetical protein